jgi:uncharacterized protein YdbL (DUF1318 family)
MKKVGVVLLVMIIFGCAKVSVQTPEPIKVDINMRVDVYQHVVKDVESINDQIYGPQNKELNSLFGLGTAYAQDLSAQASEAIARRRSRVSKIEEYFSKGYIGENRKALLEIVGDVPADIKSQVKDVINQENKDRDILYQEIANKNNTDISGIREVSFKEDYERAPSGYWFQTGSGKWAKK